MKAACLVVFALVFGAWRFETAPRPQLRNFEGKQFVVRVRDEKSPFARLRGALTDRIGAVLPSDQANLVSGMLYGEQDLTKIQKDRFRSAGLTHIVAVSGSNVTIVIQFVMLLVLRTGFRRRYVFWIATVALIFFVAFVGFAAPVARAAVMGWLFLLAKQVGRIASPSRLLLVSATFLVLLNPWSLLFDIGFALSFFAMWGLLAWTPIFQKWFIFLPERFEIRSSFCMTLAATLTTGPYIVWMFGDLSLAALFTNVLALPFISFVMGFGAIAAVWGNWPGAEYVVLPVSGFVSIIDRVAATSEYFPSLLFTFQDVPFGIIAALYTVLFYLARRFRIEPFLSTAHDQKQRERVG